MTVRTMVQRMLLLSAVAGVLSGQPVLGQTPPAKPNQSAKPDQQPRNEKEFTIFTPGEGPYYARLLPSPDAKKTDFDPQGPSSDRKVNVKFDPAQVGKSPRIAVDDTKSGNTAIVPIAAGKLSADLKSLDFDHVRRVEVKVTYDGKPLQTARVTLAPSDGSSPSVTIDPSAQGTAVFNDVPTGKAKLTIKYGDNLSEVSDIQISGEHPPGALVIQAPVKSQAPTLAATTAPAVPGASGGTPPGTAPETPQTGPAAPTGGGPGIPVAPQPAAGSGLINLVSTLLGVAFIVGIGYLIYRWHQSGGLAATLKKAGIETAGPVAPADDGSPVPWKKDSTPTVVVTDPTMCQFCGQKKDAAGNCACTISPGMAAPAAAPVGAPSQPRLVASAGAYSGSIFPLAASGVTVGRDPASDIPLSNDTTVSRKHASLQPGDGGWSVTDLGSSNGVFVNGVKIQGSQPLRPGDEVQIGNTRFRFEV